jgi:hypothetical protein
MKEADILPERPNQPESKFELGLFVSPDAELADALNELLEVHLPVPILVEDLDHPLKAKENAEVSRA